MHHANKSNQPRGKNRTEPSSIATSLIAFGLVCGLTSILPTLLAYAAAIFAFYLLMQAYIALEKWYEADYARRFKEAYARRYSSNDSGK